MWQFLIIIEAYYKSPDGWRQHDSTLLSICEDQGPDDSSSGTIRCKLKYKKQENMKNYWWITEGAKSKIRITLHANYVRSGNDNWNEEGQTKETIISFTGNKPPNTPKITKAPSELKVGEHSWFYAQGTDPESDYIMYGWDWNGDLSVDTWEPNLIESGKESGTEKHFNDAGTYQIRVKARDYLWNDESEWSEPLTITVSKARSLNNNLFGEYKTINAFIAKILNFRNA
jgi:hypothetical protein